jgi:hypothetical protein
MKLILGILAAATLAGCTLDTGPKDINTDPATETFAASLGVDIPSMTKDISNGQIMDYRKDIKIGTGDAIAGNVEIAMTYTGYVKDGRSFDSETIPLTAGETLGNFIPGLQVGLQGMQRGGERLIVVPSDFAFATGSFTGNGVHVGPNTTLIFDVTVDDFAAVP